MTGISILSSRGQVTIPQAIRDRMGLKPGDGIMFALRKDGTLIARPKILQIEALVGRLRRPGQPTVPIEEMGIVLPDADK
jgi:AbrB family looped-hinge helix DNA binding protein